MIENTISIDSTAVDEGALDNAANETKVQNFSGEEQDMKLCGNDEKTAAEDAVCKPENTENSTADQPEQTVELNLYGEKVQVPLSRAIAAAQKGMAFEHIKMQLADARNDYRLKALDALAKQSGKSTYQLVGDMQHQAVMADLLGRYGSWENVPLQEMGRAVSELEELRRNLAESEQREVRGRRTGQLMDFITANPGCTEIPDEVIAAAKNGEDISKAYSRFNGSRLEKELTEAKREIDILKSENAAAAKSTPSAKNAGASGKPKENEILKIMKSTW